MGRISAIDIRKLRHVAETARFGSITRAADALLITQSALTRSIAEVEGEIGVKLFVRLPRGVRVTDAGRSFVERARQVIDDVEDLLAGAGDYRKLHRGRLRLAIAPSGYQRFVARSIARLASDYPNLDIEITAGSTEVLPPRLSAGDFDAIIGHEALLRRWPDLEIRRIAEFHCAIMVRKGHPIAQRDDISESEILSYPLLMASTVELVQNNIALLHARHGLPPPSPRYVCDDFDLVAAIIARTNAYTPVISLNPTFGRLREKFLLLEGKLDLPVQRIAFAVSKTRAPTAAARAIESVLREEFSSRREKYSGDRSET